MLDLSGYRLTFDEEFNFRSISRTGSATTWANTRREWRYDAHSDIGFGHSSFVDPASGYDPFRVENGALTITAVPDRTPYGYAGSWESGLITTQGNFSQSYGYFEMRAQLSGGLGAWDAFWLMPDTQVTNSSNPSAWQELDIIEHYGANEGGVYSHIHTADGTSTSERQFYSEHPGITNSYHTYGVNWTADTIDFYFDGLYMGSRPTPSDMHGPMYILANLATQGVSGNNADVAGVPLSMRIDYIRAFSNDPAAVAVVQDTVSAPDGQDPGLYGASSLHHAPLQGVPATKGHFGETVYNVQKAGGQIYTLFCGLLERAPNLLEREVWADRVHHGASLASVAAMLLSSPEGQARFGVADSAGFVNQLYSTVLHREADASGLSNWTTHLLSGGLRADVAASFTLSGEHLATLASAFELGIFVPDKTASDVARLYYAVLDRAPDAEGLRGWICAVDAGASLGEVARGFLASDEYEIITTGLTDSQFVDALYQRVLGRAADAPGLQAWTAVLDHGAGRDSIAHAFTDSLEFQDSYATVPNATYVAGLYHAVLGRAGANAEVAAWAAVLDGHTTTRGQVAHAFVESAEFYNTFVAPSNGAFVNALYLNALGRPPDAEGLSYWSGALAHETSRTDLAAAFAQSAEAQQHLLPAIEQGWHLS
ncbi:DUF4214 domain-containing protein [Methylobacterium oxalidis]|uniref:DUF4214 domain-containing protein n=1 Tax=Methylobacterium oxalidis TaxID=944322 RepID=UPI0033149BEA